MTDADWLAVLLRQQLRTAMETAPPWQQRVIEPALDRIGFTVGPAQAPRRLAAVTVTVDGRPAFIGELAAADLAAASSLYVWQLVGLLTLTAPP